MSQSTEQSTRGLNDLDFLLELHRAAQKDVAATREQLQARQATANAIERRIVDFRQRNTTRPPNTR